MQLYQFFELIVQVTQPISQALQLLVMVSAKKLIGHVVLHPPILS